MAWYNSGNWDKIAIDDHFGGMMESLLLATNERQAAVGFSETDFYYNDSGNQKTYPSDSELAAMKRGGPGYMYSNLYLLQLRLEYLDARKLDDDATAAGRGWFTDNTFTSQYGTPDTGNQTVKDVVDLGEFFDFTGFPPRIISDYVFYERARQILDLMCYVKIRIPVTFASMTFNSCDRRTGATWAACVAASPTSGSTSNLQTIKYNGGLYFIHDNTDHDCDGTLYAGSITQTDLVYTITTTHDRGAGDPSTLSITANGNAGSVDVPATAGSTFGVATTLPSWPNFASSANNLVIAFSSLPSNFPTNEGGGIDAVVDIAFAVDICVNLTSVLTDQA